MTRFEISPRAPAHRHLPAVALLGLLLILSISHVYLQLAYPLHATGLAMGVFILALSLFLIPGTERIQGGNFSGPALWAIVAQVAWLLWNYISQLRAPVAAMGRMEFATIFLGFLVFWIAAEASRRWSRLPLPESLSSGESLGTVSSGGLSSGGLSSGDLDNPIEFPRARPSTPFSGSLLSPFQITGLWWIAAGVLLSIYAIYQVYGPAGWPKTFASLYKALYTLDSDLAETDLTIGGILHALKEGRAFATFGAPNVFAGFLVPALALLTAFFLSGRTWTKRGTALLGGGIVVAALILSQSRGGMLASVCAVGWVLARWLRFKWREHKGGQSLLQNGDNMRTHSIISGLLGVCILVLTLPFLISASSQTSATSSSLSPSSDSTSSSVAVGTLQSANVAQTSNAAHSSNSSHSIQTSYRTLGEHLLSPRTGVQRFYYWKTAWSLWSRQFWLGNGCGSFEVFYPQLRRPGAGETSYAHNWILQIGSETGAIGLGIFLCLLGWIFWKGEIDCVSFRSTAVQLGMQGAAIGLLVHGLMDYTLSQRELYLDLQLMLGLMVGGGIRFDPRGRTSSRSPDLENGNASDAPEPEGEKIRNVGMIGAHSWAMMGVKGLVVVAAGVLMIQEVYYPTLAHFYSSAARDLARDLDQHAPSKTMYLKALRWEPDDPWNLAAVGMAEIEEGNPRGLDRIRRALTIHPYSASLQSILAQACDQLGLPDAALEASRRAVELHPLKPDYRLSLAEHLLARSRNDEAREQLRAIDPSTLYPFQRRRLELLNARIGPPPRLATQRPNGANSTPAQGNALGNEWINPASPVRAIHP